MRALQNFARSWKAIPDAARWPIDGVDDLLAASGTTASSRDDYRRLETTTKKNLEKAIGLAQRRRVRHERDLFTEFSYRDGGNFRSSWHALAAAQHYQTGTRLLDWSDSLLVGVAFAIAEYSSTLSSTELLRGPSLETKVIELLNSRPSPAVWVLNPYHLAAGSELTSILDPTWDGSLDYYKMFLMEEIEWSVSAPLPLTIPWETPRIAAQRGTFTVHGLCPLSLDDQVARTVVGKCPLTRFAAIYAVYVVRDVCAFDAYTLNRDRHNLGESIRLRHLGY